MAGRPTILGPHEGRVKTDVRLMAELANTVDKVCKQLGIPKNIFYTIAASWLLAQLVPVATIKRRAALKKKISGILQKIDENL